ncbi:hypothetical protein DCCM_2927 [Desulfocucumis palustris]|uniref:Uncharacterized protein n=1 Tax=Desulfocucumis palustris TaxID=1898651 RepID=A0A2L2XHV5_9FIRM|nr:hypothetical protein DCCM_2927 [Desulfocucumis palustris]
MLEAHLLIQLQGFSCFQNISASFRYYYPLILVARLTIPVMIVAREIIANIVIVASINNILVTIAIGL